MKSVFFILYEGTQLDWRDIFENVREGNIYTTRELAVKELQDLADEKNEEFEADPDDDGTIRMRLYKENDVVVGAFMGEENDLPGDCDHSWSVIERPLIGA